MDEIGTSPIVVLAVTSADPVMSTCRLSLRVTPANNVAKAVGSRACRGMSLKEIGKSAMLPVETPPLAAVLGIVSWNEGDGGQR